MLRIQNPANYLITPISTRKTRPRYARNNTFSITALSHVTDLQLTPLKSMSASQIFIGASFTNPAEQVPGLPIAFL